MTSFAQGWVVTGPWIDNIPRRTDSSRLCAYLDSTRPFAPSRGCHSPSARSLVQIRHFPPVALTPDGEPSTQSGSGPVFIVQTESSY